MQEQSLLRTIRFLALFAAGYLALAYVGAAYSVRPDFATTWPPAGLFVAALLLNPKRRWPAFFAAALLANATFDLSMGRSLGLSLLFFAVNATEALMGVLLFRRFVSDTVNLARPRHLVGLWGLSALIAPLVGAALGATVVSLTAPGSAWSTTFPIWYAADALGVMIVAPFVIAAVPYVRDGEPAPETRHVLETLAILAALCAVTFTVFAPAAGLPMAGKWLVTLLIVLAAWRLAPLGLAVAGTSVSGVALLYASSASAALRGAALESRVAHLQIFLASSLFAAYLVSALIARRQAAEAAAVTARRKYEALFSVVPVGIALVDDDGRILERNKEFARLAQSSPEGDKPLMIDDIDMRPEEGTEARLGIHANHERPFSERLADMAPVRHSITRGDETASWVKLSYEGLSSEDARMHIIAMADLTREMEDTEALARYRDRLRALAMTLAETQERERQQLAMELHDRVSQTLAVAKISLVHALQTKDFPAAENHMGHVLNAITDALTESREITESLSPAVLYELGLDSAIEWMVSRMAPTPPPEIHLLHTKCAQLEERARVAVYMCLRELLANAIRHAGAANIWIEGCATPPQCALTVRDDGKGFPVGGRDSKHRHRSGFGLLVVRERMARLGGHIDVQTTPGGGTSVTLHLPTRDEDAS